MEKKLYLATAVMVFVLLSLIIILSVLSSKKKTATSEINQTDDMATTQLQDESLPVLQNQADGTTEETVNKSYPPPESPEYAAREFYKWYNGHPDPLGSGAFKNSPYVSTGFKETLEDFIILGDYKENDPVLNCIGVTDSPKTLVPQAATFDAAKLKATVILQEEIGEKRDLYRVILINENSKWLVKDFYCAF
ncbi:hypothetical protein A2774_01100 [Candidatus Roizmanbacteria bacterium RIFCSPHIGHO2_01_FULL_39_12c]|uniref:DUF3828 domain-containing protein n=1 Tax=Candidatus Roizmanbacteria bacterium RIFCSPHIGHO2_01_FULL_39_12c TaxID=1802031 RepID=A0A1F7G8C2_9BACT|nr:MAG: hypothetical protein A2774_01100 [Candidatus Roizmanbacteria bacterium RIFCSPHIGHO2_01_FULL_39_12c]OGK46427.1 MAG: hypothetical protein A2963_01510 [Candidatus Roizmanbacteria bacterium RIFCSPLOWO2_01_FULL_40_13]